MPIIEKIDLAKNAYGKKLNEFRKAAAVESRDTSYEKELIQMLTDMIEIKTEIEILTRVQNHRDNNPG